MRKGLQALTVSAAVLAGCGEKGPIESVPKKSGALILTIQKENTEDMRFLLGTNPAKEQIKSDIEAGRSALLLTCLNVIEKAEHELAKDPNNEEATINLANGYAYAGQTEAALLILNAFLERYPDSKAILQRKNSIEKIGVPPPEEIMPPPIVEPEDIYQAV